MMQKCEKVAVTENDFRRNGLKNRQTEEFDGNICWKYVKTGLPSRMYNTNSAYHNEYLKLLSKNSAKRLDRKKVRYFYLLICDKQLIFQNLKNSRAL